MDAKIFQVDVLEPTRYSMAIMCKSYTTELCRSQDFIASISFDRTIPSSLHGVYTFEETISQRFKNQDAFELQVHLSKINVVEYDAHSEMVSNTTNITMNDET
jgi:hypothetical protein